jgi:hypothetical protein
MTERFDPADTIVYLGFDWTEESRFEKSVAPWKPWTIVAPLMDPPFLTKYQILDSMHDRGITPPRLYGMGFGHANCGGACVRGGQAQWRRLLNVMPDRYAVWEAEEETTRVMLGKNVSILRDRQGGTSSPLTLRAFRERLDSGPSLFDADDVGACGCFDDEVTA